MSHPKWFLALVLSFTISFSLVTADSAAKSTPQIEFIWQKVAFQIGETKIHAHSRQFGSSPLTMVNVHDDEQASVEAGVAVLEKHGGRLIELVHSGQRRIVFTWQGQTYSFDPNRIFSKAGVRTTLQREGNPTPSGKPIPQAVHQIVDRFAAQFIQHFQLARQRAFITLHNNGEGGLSIHTYEPGGEWADDTDELHVSTQADPDDFFFVTNKRIYEKLKQLNLNVILQDNRIRRDDGSLSVFAGRHRIRYINVEAEPKRLAEQIRMLETAVAIID